MHPAEYIGPHQKYYPATRVPWLALGAAFYAVLPAVYANIGLKSTVFFFTLLFFFSAAERAAGRLAAGVASVLLGTYAFFVMSVGWDYIDGMVVMLFAAASEAAIRAADREVGPPIKEALVGGIYAALVSCNIFSLALLPSLLLLYSAALARAGRFGWTGSLERVSGAVLGFFGACVALGLLNKSLSGDPFYLLTQVRAAIDLSAPASAAATWSIRFQPWAFLLPVSTWLAVPASVCVLSIFTAAVSGMSYIRSPGRDHLFMFLASAQYILAFALFALSTVVSLAVLLFWFYTSYLDIAAFLTLACTLHYFWRGASPRGVLPWIVAAAVMLLSFEPHLGLLVQDDLHFQPGAVAFVTSFAWVLPALILLIMAGRFRSSILIAAASIVLGVGNISMMSQAQLSPRFAEDRVPGFLAVVDLAEAIHAQDGNPRRYVWVDRSEERDGGLFHAAWIESLLSSKSPIGSDSATRFPDLPSFGFEAGDLVIIATSRVDWLEAADARLTGLHLAFKPASVKVVREGSVKFTVASGTLAPT